MTRHDVFMKAFLAWVVAGAGAVAPRAQSFCDLVVKACPKNFPGVITVPKNTTALSAVMPTCNEQIQVNKPTVVPPSIVFIIDNSTSMSTNDPQEARFSETVKMLDTLFAQAKDARIGIVSFSRVLQFDSRSGHYLAPSPVGDTSWHDAYIPLTRLDTTFSDGKRGVDTLKALLKHNTSGNLTYGKATGGGGTNTRNGTDISLGFEAAKIAMQASPSKPENRYFIFLSDGEAGNVDASRAAMLNDYVKGLAAPTTFTVFFNAEGQSFDSITAMTNNIKANGYSTSNPKSAIWDIDDPSSDLQQLLQTQILGNIIIAAPATGQSAILTSGNLTQNSSSFQNGAFTFSKRIPLQEDRTVVDFTVNYRYIDSVTLQPKDTVFKYQLTVQRTGAANPSGTETSCRAAPQIALLANGAPITTVTADHPTVTAQVTLPAGQTCTACTAGLGSVKSPDKETIALGGGANVVAGNFSREVSTTPVTGDKKLQHLAIGDSIVVTFLNPEYPLETARRAFKYENTGTLLESAWQNPIARTVPDAAMPEGKQFLIVGAANLKTEGLGGSTNCCVSQANWTPANIKDTANYTGISLEVTREFSAELRIYDNLGMLVNETSFRIARAEFEKIPIADALSRTRKVQLLWNGRTLQGQRVGMGAYIVMGKVRLATEAGVAEDKKEYRFSKRIGVLRHE